jgi:hypothetical protein
MRQGRAWGGRDRAVQDKRFDLTVRNIKKHNSVFDEVELMGLIDEAMTYVRSNAPKQ